MDKINRLSDLNDFRKRKFRQYYQELSFLFFLGKKIPHGLGKKGEELINRVIWETAYHHAKKPASSFGCIEVVYENGKSCIRWVSDNEGCSLTGKPDDKIEDLEKTIEMALMSNENATRMFFYEWLEEHKICEMADELIQDLYAAYSDSVRQYGIDSTNAIFIKHPIWKDERFKKYRTL